MYRLSFKRIKMEIGKSEQFVAASAGINDFGIFEEALQSSNGKELEMPNIPIPQDLEHNETPTEICPQDPIFES